MPEVRPEVISSIKASQALKPLFEFSGACAGCGETPYVKLATQLFGDRMIIANATGCSSIYGGSAPTCPYTVNEEGYGPAWANSLFEDNAEFGFGMNLAYTQRRAKLVDTVKALIAVDYTVPEIKQAGQEWLDGMEDAKTSKAAGKSCSPPVRTASLKAAIAKPARWPALWWPMLICSRRRASGSSAATAGRMISGTAELTTCWRRIRMSTFWCWIRSSTPIPAASPPRQRRPAPWQSSRAAGKRTKKKDLGMMAMSYGYVYVASVAMSANPQQLLKAMNEAEAYHGPSLIIAYSPCINHGINMSLSQAEIKKAVDCGYWTLYRFNPDLTAEGKNPLTLDSKEPAGGYQDFPQERDSLCLTG